MTHKNKEEQDYQIQILGRHVQVTEAMKQYAWDKLSKIERLQGHIIHVHVVMDVQKMEHSISIVMKLDHIKIKAQAVSSDMYVSIDQAIERLQTQIRRWKDRIQDHTQQKRAFVDMQVNVFQRPYDELEELNAEIEAANKEANKKKFRIGSVIGQKTLPLKDLTVDEAIMKMELSGDPFLVYRGEEDRKLKVIYRRDDGNYGIMQPDI